MSHMHEYYWHVLQVAKLKIDLFIVIVKKMFFPDQAAPINRESNLVLEQNCHKLKMLEVSHFVLEPVTTLKEPTIVLSQLLKTNK